MISWILPVFLMVKEGEGAPFDHQTGYTIECETRMDNSHMGWRWGTAMRKRIDQDQGERLAVSIEIHRYILNKSCYMGKRKKN